jgi:hypothetical protein
MEFLNNSPTFVEDTLFNKNEVDLLGRVVAYVIVTDKETDQRQIYRLHLEVSNNRNEIIAAARKSIDAHSTLTAVMWTTPKNKKRMWIYDGDILLKGDRDIDAIKQMWKELGPQETDEDKEVQRYHSALREPNE